MDPEPSGNRRGRGTWESRRATEQRRRPTFTHIPCPPGDTKAFIWTAVGCPSRTLETPPQGPGIRAPGSGLERGQARDAGCLALAWGGQPPQHRAVAWGPPSLPTKILGVRVEVWGRSPRPGTSSHPQLWPLGHPGSSHSDPGGQAGGPPQTSACAGAEGPARGRGSAVCFPSMSQVSAATASSLVKRSLILSGVLAGAERCPAPQVP